MATFLFTLPGFIGHINPALCVGAALLKRGHRVVWVGTRNPGEEFIPEGGRFIVPDELKAHMYRFDQMLEEHNKLKLSSPETMMFMFSNVFIPLCDFMVEGISRLIDEIQPDVVISDETMFVGAICAYKKGIPYATSVAVPPDLFLLSQSEFPKVEEWQWQQIRQMQRKHGIIEEKRIVSSPDLVLVYSSNAFCGKRRYPDHYQFIGPMRVHRNAQSDFNWDKFHQHDSPKIFVSMGTLLGDFGDVKKIFFSKIAEALAGEPITVVAAADPELLDRWPDNFIVQPYVPQAELVPRMDAIIYHGGFNTVNEALFNGVPLIIIPVAYDNFYIAQMVVNARCGLRLNFRRLKAEVIRSSVKEILHNPDYRKAANEIGNSLRAAGGAERAATLLEELAVRKKSDVMTLATIDDNNLID